jgi:hypothetical protein
MLAAASHAPSAGRGGLVAYLGPPAAKFGARQLYDANARIGDLLAACGERAVRDAYCRSLSGVDRGAGRGGLVSHSPEAVLDLCQRVVWLYEGRVVADRAGGRDSAELSGARDSGQQDPAAG